MFVVCLQWGLRYGTLEVQWSAAGIEKTVQKDSIVCLKLRILTRNLYFTTVPIGNFTKFRDLKDCDIVWLETEIFEKKKIHT